MTVVLSQIGALLLAVAILIMGNGLQSTLLPVRASLESFDPLAIGLMGSAFYMGFVGGCVLGARMIRRVGHIRAFTALASVASTVVLVHAVAIDPLAWAALRAVSGFCIAGLFLVIESWLNEKADNTNRGLVMGVYTMINLSVIVIGQMMLTLDDPSRFPLFALASILVSLAVVPVALTVASQPAPVAEVRLRPLRLYRQSPAGLVGAFLAGIAAGAFWSLGPAYAAARGAGIDEIAVFMSIVVLGGALAQWPIGRLSDRFDRRRVILGVAALGAAAAIALSLHGAAGGPAAQLLAAAFGAAALPLYAICAAHTFDHVDRAEFVEAASGLLLANGVGSIIGPLLAAMVMRGAGPSGLFVTTAVFHLLVIGFVAWRMTRRPPAPEEQRTGFDLTATAATMATLEPHPAPEG